MYCGIGRALVMLGLGLLCCCAAATAEDVGGWPAAGGSASRAGFTPDRLQFPLELRWRHQPSAPPAPAWPAPARGSYWQQLTRIEPRVVDDRTFHPISVGDAVLYASSSDDALHCLDAATGQRRWKFVTDGPLRYAPFVHQQTAYFGGDDGCLYAVRLDSGQLLWRQRLDLDRRIVGNGRVISAWPIRGGVLVRDNVVYAAAGLFPSQGVTVFAFSCDDGKQLWKSPSAHSLQGYLLAGSQELLIPTGRLTPIAVSRVDGTTLGGFGGEPGSYAALIGDVLINGRGNRGQVSFSSQSGRQLLGQLPVRHVSADSQRVYLLGDGKLRALDRARWSQLTSELSQQKTTLAERQRREDVWEHLTLWNIECEDQEALAVCGNAVIVGGQQAVTAYDVASGEVLWQAPVPGGAARLAISENRLVLSNADGELLCFGSISATDAPAIPSSWRRRPPRVPRPTPRPIRRSPLWRRRFWRQHTRRVAGFVLCAESWTGSWRWRSPGKASCKWSRWIAILNAWPRLAVWPSSTGSMGGESPCTESMTSGFR